VHVNIASLQLHYITLHYITDVRCRPAMWLLTLRRTDHWLWVGGGVRRRLQRVSALRGARSTAADVRLLAARRQQHRRRRRRVGRTLLEHRHGACSRPAWPLPVRLADKKLSWQPARRPIYCIQSTFRFRYIFCNYRKAYCTPSTASASTGRQTLFNRAMLCVSAAIAVVTWLSVCHTPVLYRNG